MAPGYGDFLQLAKSDGKGGFFVLDSSTTTGLRIESRTRWRGWKIGWREDLDGARRRSDAAVNRVLRNALADRFGDGFASRIASRHLDLEGNKPLSLRRVRAVIHEAETHISNEHVASEICGTGDEVRFQEMLGRARFPSDEYRDEVVTFLGEPGNLNAVRENLRAWLLCDREMGDDGRKSLDSVQAVLPRAVEKLPELIVEGIRDHNRFLIDDFTTAAGAGFRGAADEGFNQYAVSGVDPSLFEGGLAGWIRKRITSILPENTFQPLPRPLSRDEVSSAAGSAFREYLALRIPHLRRIDDAFQGELIDDFRKTQLWKLVLNDETFLISGCPSMRESRRNGETSG